MKKFIIGIVTIVLFTSCAKFLDRTPLAEEDEDNFWITPEDAKKGLNAVYATLPDSRDFWRDCHSDNSVMTNSWGEGGMGFICQGIQSASDSYIKEEWKYDNIRIALYFLNKLRGMNIDSNLAKQYSSEARFILATRYFRMVKLFGDIPLIEESPVALDESALPRSPAQDVLDYVLANVDSAVTNLPLNYPANDAGRITKGAALMLKADVYLYMASMKKFHQSQDDPMLWKQAADAAQAVIDLGLYDLETNYAYLFGHEANNNSKEVILARQYAKDEITHSLPLLAAPTGTGISGQGWGSFCPTRKLIDSYLCSDGIAIDKSSLYDKNNPWENRDKRLKQTFLLPGDSCLRPDGSYRPYEPHPFYNQPEQINNEGGGITGYMYLKFAEVTNPQPDKSYTNYPLYRYAETLLILAEALNEYSPSDHKIVEAVNQIRTRAGLPGVDNLLGNQDSMRQIIREERRHEFPAEHKRYFDILRWKTAENVLNEPAYGINEDQNAPIGDFTVPEFKAQDRTFDPSKHYLWPIPQSALDNNKNLTQNPGW